MKIISVLIFLLFFGNLWSQRDDILQKEKKEFAFKAIKELKDGCLVLRLHTNYKKISILEQTINKSSISEAKKKRHQNMLDATIKMRDAFNQTLSRIFVDSFSFCSVYLMYDTCFNQLKKGVDSGIFLNRSFEYSDSIHLKNKNIFIVNFKEKSGEFPFDILRIRKLEEKLDEPFPYFTPIRASWINNVNTPRAANAVIQLNRRLYGFYLRALEYENKKQSRNKKSE